MKKQILLISLMVFSIQSLIAQDAEVAQPSWWQQKQEQAYGIGQTGWEKTKKGIAWIKENPKKAAAIGLGAAALVGTGVYGLRRRRRTPKVLEARRKVPNYVVKARKIREQLRQQVISFYTGRFQTTIEPPLFVFTNIYEGKSPQDIDLDEVGYYGDITFFLKELPSYRVPFSVSQYGFYDVRSPAEAHSLISVALISPKEEKKEDRINELVSYGVRLTDDDKKLLALYNWEKSTSVQKAMYTALLPGEKAIIPTAQMTPEVRKKIEEGRVAPIRILPPELHKFISKFTEEPLETEEGLE